MVICVLLGVSGVMKELLKYVLIIFGVSFLFLAGIKKMQRSFVSNLDMNLKVYLEIDITAGLCINRYHILQ